MLITSGPMRGGRTPLPTGDQTPWLSLLTYGLPLSRLGIAQASLALRSLLHRFQHLKGYLFDFVLALASDQRSSGREFTIRAKPLGSCSGKRQAGYFQSLRLVKASKARASLSHHLRMNGHEKSRLGVWGLEGGSVVYGGVLFHLCWFEVDDVEFIVVKPVAYLRFGVGYVFCVVFVANDASYLAYGGHEGE